ncbi:hypothetical protein BKA63DRAFT_522593 [Paraphoma chrysanthemicola]|nr:hypothetical protein BKA63DRAFT_522593 [Paraphoma chrysanthemicola]
MANTMKQSIHEFTCLVDSFDPNKRNHLLPIQDLILHFLYTFSPLRSVLCHQYVLVKLYIFPSHSQPASHIPHPLFSLIFRSSSVLVGFVYNTQVQCFQHATKKRVRSTCDQDCQSMAAGLMELGISRLGRYVPRHIMRVFDFWKESRRVWGIGKAEVQVCDACEKGSDHVHFTRVCCFVWFGVGLESMSVVGKDWGDENGQDVAGALAHPRGRKGQVVSSLLRVKSHEAVPVCMKLDGAGQLVVVQCITSLGECLVVCVA